MNEILKKSIKDLNRELNAAIWAAQSKDVPVELQLFKDWLHTYYSGLKNTLTQMEYLVSLDDEDIHENIINQLSTAVRRFRLVNTRFLPGIYRGHDNDRLSLKVLDWLHKQHDQTRNKAFVIMDGNFAIFSAILLPASYYLPIPSQQSLLFMPLFFHEVGHYLYQHHKDEMDDLVKELQNKLEEHQIAPTRQNDKNYADRLEKNKRIIEAWYEWAQELFCDAVGIEIGGKTYLKAFSYYLRMLGRNSFFVPEKDLYHSGHPVTWLRIKFLVERAVKLGLANEARELDEEWQKIARTLKVREDYFGFYTPGYHQDILQIIDFMVEEANPIKFSDYLKDGKTSEPDARNFICIMYEAWDKFEQQPDEFDDWERSLIEKICTN